MPQLPIRRQMPLYKDIREMLDGCALLYNEEPIYIIKTKRETKTEPAQYRTISFMEHRREVSWLGTALMQLGLKGKRLAIIGRNRSEWMLGYYAFQCGLGVIVPLDKGLPLEEIEMSLTKAGADALLFDKDHLDLVERLRMREEYKDMLCISMDRLEGYPSVPELIEQGKNAPEKVQKEFCDLPVDGNALSIILFTSGTSGLAKAVMLSQYNITYNIWSVLSVEDLRRGDVNMALVPYHHTFGSTGQAMMSCVGMTSVYCDGLKYVQKNIIEYKVSVSSACRC